MSTTSKNTQENTQEAIPENAQEATPENHQDATPENAQEAAPEFDIEATVQGALESLQDNIDQKNLMLGANDEQLSNSTEEILKYEHIFSDFPGIHSPFDPTSRDYDIIYGMLLGIRVHVLLSQNPPDPLTTKHYNEYEKVDIPNQGSHISPQHSGDYDYKFKAYCIVLPA